MAGLFDVVVAGDGPGGMSAALFLARAGLQVVVYGLDQTALHDATLNNYLGLEQLSGTEFQRVCRGQVEEAGVEFREERVLVARANDEVVAVRASSGNTQLGRYLILGEGNRMPLAKALGVERSRSGVSVDRNHRTNIDRVYAVGHMVRLLGSQAIISASDGCIAALDIIRRERGTHAYTDWDVAQ